MRRAFRTTHVCVLCFLVFTIVLGSACPRYPTSKRSSPRCSSVSSFASFHHQEAVAGWRCSTSGKDIVKVQCSGPLSIHRITDGRFPCCGTTFWSRQGRNYVLCAITCSEFTRARVSITRLCVPVLQLSPEVKDLLDRILVPKEEDRITIPEIEAHRWCVSTCFV